MGGEKTGHMRQVAGECTLPSSLPSFSVLDKKKILPQASSDDIFVCPSEGVCFSFQITSKDISSLLPLTLNFILSA